MLKLERLVNDFAEVAREEIFLSVEELEELEQHEDIENIEDCGMSGYYIGYHYYVAHSSVIGSFNVYVK